MSYRPFDFSAILNRYRQNNGNIKPTQLKQHTQD